MAQSAVQCFTMVTYDQQSQEIKGWPPHPAKSFESFEVTSCSSKLFPFVYSQGILFTPYVFTLVAELPVAYLPGISLNKSPLSPIP